MHVKEVTNEQCCKSSKIFRPWDSAKNIPQDSTVSTTSDEVERVPSTFCTKVEEKAEEFISQQERNPNTLSHNHNTTLEYPIYPEVFHANLAQSLGIPPGDPLLLESMAQGYALEEYARVINQEHQAKLLQNRKQRPKKYKCPHCNVGFSNNGQLKGHIRIHTGERPFKCDEKNCGKTFTRNEELTRHKRIHSGLRPFPCAQCGKRFGRKDHLKKHTRTHLQPRGLYAVPVMLPLDTWASTSSYSFVPMLY